LGDAVIPVAFVLAANAIVQLQASNQGFDLKVQVVEALEGGPVILDVTLTNLKNRVVPVPHWSRNESCRQVPDDWVSVQGRCAGTQFAPFDLEPGRSLTERHLLHVDYASKFIPGTYPVTVFWPLRIPRSDELRALPFKTVKITIARATPVNLTVFERRLSTTLDAVPADDSFIPRLRDLCDRVAYTSHTSLIPFELKLLEKCPIGTGQYPDPLRHIRRDLVATIFRIDPTTAHRTFVDRLAAKTQSDDPTPVFGAWSSARFDFHTVLGQYRWSQIAADFVQHRNSAWFLNDVAILFASSLYVAPPRILPGKELDRLCRAEDFWVRALTFAHFADRLDKDWQDAFLKSVSTRRSTPTLSSRGQICMDCISDLNPGGTWLLDAFAAGPDEDAVTKIARTKISHRDK
jgi:hypothetical protein